MTRAVDEQWLTVEDVVTLLKVHEETVRKWLREGTLRGVLLSRKSGYRIRASDLDRFLAERETGQTRKPAA